MEELAEAIYARQSLDKKDSISIETQVELGKKRCEGNNIRIYIDKGYSGKNTNRPDYIRMFQDIRDKQIRRIIVYRLDRFSRSLMDFCLAWDTMSKYHVEFVSVNENFDTSTPVGKAMVYIIMIFAQLEREVTGERIKDNYYSRTGEGHWPGGPPPYGFELCKRTAENGRNYPSLEFNEYINIVEAKAKQYLEMDCSLSKIRNDLNKEGYTTVNGKKWSNTTVSKLLKNVCYVKADAELYLYFKQQGVRIVNQIEEFTGERAALLIGKNNSAAIEKLSDNEKEGLQLSLASWPGKLDSHLWIGIQKKLGENKALKNSGRGKHTWLSGLIKCGNCSRAVIPIVHSKPRKPCDKIRRLYCSGHMQHQGCDIISFNVRLDDIEDEVERELIALMDRCKEEPIDEKVEIISNTDKIELAKIEEEIGSLVRSLATNILEDAAIQYVNQEINKLSQRKNEIASRVIVKKQPVYRKKIDFPSLEFEEKKIVAKNFIQRIVLNEYDFIIEWKV